MHVIKVSEENYMALNRIAGDMRKERGKPISLNYALSQLLAKRMDTPDEKIAGALSERKEIAACYLFGSAAKGGEGNDTDIGILLREGFKLPALYEGAIVQELKAAGIRNPDARILNNSSVRFLNQVLRYGRLIFSQDEGARIRFETRVTKRYADMKRLHEEYDTERIRRLLHAGQRHD